MHLRRPPINQTFVLQEPEENHLPKMWTLSPKYTQTISESVEVCGLCERCSVQSPRREEAWSTHRAELAAGDNDPSLVQHAGIQLEHAGHVHGHEVLRQVPLYGGDAGQLQRTLGAREGSSYTYQRGRSSKAVLRTNGTHSNH